MHGRIWIAWSVQAATAKQLKDIIYRFGLHNDCLAILAVTAVAGKKETASVSCQYAE